MLKVYNEEISEIFKLRKLVSEVCLKNKEKVSKILTLTGFLISIYNEQLA